MYVFVPNTATKKDLLSFSLCCACRPTKVTEEHERHPELKNEHANSAYTWVKNTFWRFSEQIKAVGGWLTLAQATSFKLGQQSPLLVKKKKKYFLYLRASWNLMHWVYASTGLYVSIWEGECLHFAVERRRWLIFVAPVTCRCFCLKQLPLWIRSGRGRCIVAGSSYFFCPNSVGRMYAECWQNVIAFYWFRKPEELIDDFESGLWSFPFIGSLFCSMREMRDSLCVLKVTSNYYHSTPPSKCTAKHLFPCIISRILCRSWRKKHK